MKCPKCASGKHSHDLWTGSDGVHEAGTDAGCSNLAPDGQECTCDVTLPPTRPGRCPRCGCTTHGASL